MLPRQIFDIHPHSLSLRVFHLWQTNFAFYEELIGLMMFLV